jgi:hypothetical protein
LPPVICDLCRIIIQQGELYKKNEKEISGKFGKNVVLYMLQEDNTKEK